MYLIRLRSIDQLFMLFIYFQLHVYIAVKTRVFIQNFLSQDQEPASNENLKIYDHDQRGSSLCKAKLGRQIEEPRENGNPRDVANHFKNFPTVDSAFVDDDFTVLPTIVPTDTLEHLKNCKKNTRKSADAVAEFASSKGLGMLSFFLRPPSVCESKFRG